MAPSVFSFVFIFLIAFASSTAIATPSSSSSSVGVTYKPPELKDLIATLEPLKDNSIRLISTLESVKMYSVRLIDSDPDIIASFTNSSINLHLTIPNSLIPSMASNRSEALHWLNRHVTPFYPEVHITLISVGNISDSNMSESENFLLTAMINIRQALDELGMDKIQVSTTFSLFHVMSTTFPPSSAQFEKSVAESLIKPVLTFLTETNSSFLINVCQDYIFPFGFFDFKESTHDLITGMKYTNVFDMVVDSVITAIASLGHKDHVPVIVTESELPSIDEMEDMVDWEHRLFAEIYFRGLLRQEPPLRRTAVIEISLVLNMSQKYRIDFFSGAIHRRPKRILDAAEPDDMSPKYHSNFFSAVALETISLLFRKMMCFFFVIYFLLAAHDEYAFSPVVYVLWFLAPVVVIILFLW